MQVLPRSETAFNKHVGLTMNGFWLRESTTYIFVIWWTVLSFILPITIGEQFMRPKVAHHASNLMRDFQTWLITQVTAARGAAVIKAIWNSQNKLYLLALVFTGVKQWVGDMHFPKTGKMPRLARLIAICQWSFSSPWSCLLPWTLRLPTVALQVTGKLLKSVIWPKLLIKVSPFPLIVL